MEEEVSYRQVGREKGYARPPKLKDDDKRRKRCSIEQDAFGNRTHRFQEIANDIPPPGAYYRQSTLERDPRTCGSVSAKGCGAGFVSATPRFRDLKHLQEASLPGPGAYLETSDSFSGGAKLASFPTLKRDCGFTRDPKSKVPGPGQYDLGGKSRPRARSGPSSSFRCVRQAFYSTPGKTDTPAPGSYELHAPAPRKVDKSGRALKDPFFRSQTKRDAFPVTTGGVPGPGEYDLDPGVPGVPGAKSTITGGGGGGTGMRVFQTRTVSSRDDASGTPGPGWYTPHQDDEKKSPASASMFRSSTARFPAPTTPRAPGPAFYQPEPLIRKSFRCDPTRKWI